MRCWVSSFPVVAGAAPSPATSTPQRGRRQVNGTRGITKRFRHDSRRCIDRRGRPCDGRDRDRRSGSSHCHHRLRVALRSGSSQPATRECTRNLDASHRQVPRAGHCSRRCSPADPGVAALDVTSRRPFQPASTRQDGVGEGGSPRVHSIGIAPVVTTSCAVDALNTASQLRRPARTTVVYSHRGSQFRSQAPAPSTATGSSGRWAGRAPVPPTSPWRRSSASPNEPSTAVGGKPARIFEASVIWIEKTYHRRPRQPALSRLTPVEYETLFRAGHTA